MELISKYFRLLIVNSEKGTQYGTEFHNDKPWKWVLESGSEDLSTWVAVEAFENGLGEIEITTYTKELGETEREKFVYTWNKKTHAYEKAQDPRIVSQEVGVG